MVGGDGNREWDPILMFIRFGRRRMETLSSERVDGSVAADYDGEGRRLAADDDGEGRGSAADEGRGCGGGGCGPAADENAVDPGGDEANEEGMERVTDATRGYLGRTGLEPGRGQGTTQQQGVGLARGQQNNWRTN